jgi:hypothetical protein
MSRHTRLAILTALSLVAALPALAQSTPQRIRGTVTTLEGNTLTVLTREGATARIQLAPSYTVATVVPATLADAKPGSFIGAAAAGPKDHLRALEVLIFPESLRGSGEGHFPWDLAPDSTMTNATIESEVTGANGRELTVVAKGERLTMTVPPDVPVVTFQPGDAAMLTPGAKVFIGAQKASDGTLAAARVNAGKDGLTPPM